MSKSQGESPFLPKMEYTNLGASGLKISKIILGAMSFGTTRFEPWQLEEAEGLPLLEHAFKRGFNTWDTADVYGLGRSELIIGKAIKQYKIPRNKLVLLTKCYYAVDDALFTDSGVSWANCMKNDGAMVNQCGLSRKHIFDAVDGSVERLGTYIDVLQIHRLDKGTPKEEIMKALNDVVESGKVRYIGASSMPAWEFQMLQSIAEKNGWHKFISMQNYHNLIYREEEREMVPYCKATGVGLIPWSPLARGVVARPWGEKSSKRAQSDAHKGFMFPANEVENNKIIVDRVEEIAKKNGKSMAATAVAWSWKKGMNPIIGMGSKERIDEAVGMMGTTLSDEDMVALDELYQPKNIAKAW